MSEERDRRVPPGEGPEREAPAAAEGPPSDASRAIGETTILSDGQLGGANLERGPERVNPEGSVDIANPPQDER